ncbi:MAG: hypothetical protein RML12_04530 [Xanthomonadales bacterium]|nr:hypothetical protein [Xanthomonadales bacterium]
MRYWPEDADALLMLAEIVDTLVRRAERALAEGDRDALRDALAEARGYAALRGEEGQRFLADLAGRLRAQGSGRLRRAELAALLREYGLAVGVGRRRPPLPRPSRNAPPPRPRSRRRACRRPRSRAPSPRRRHRRRTPSWWCQCGCPSSTPPPSRPATSPPCRSR